MKKIIVPVDFSIHSENALKTAAHIAKRENSEIVVVHMLELSSALISQSENFTQQQTAFYLRLAEKRFEEFLDKDYLSGITLTPIVKYFKIFSELNDIAKEKSADLIVMGSRGASGLKEIFVGSNTEKVVRSSSIPVLVVKEVPITSDFKTALFASSFSDNHVTPYSKARKLLKGFGCRLQLLNVNTPYAKFRSTKEQQKRVAEFLQKVDGNLDDMNNVAFVSDYTVKEGILEYANLNGVDLIVMATHGRKGINHFFEGSISEDVANHSTLPVMTFKI